MEILRSAHRHPLLLTGGENEDDKPVVCYICKDLICGPRFSCFTCKSHFHESCTDLPPRLLDHPLHPRHPLSLIPGHALKRYICDACDEGGNGFVYRCSQCRCHLHIRCALSADREGNVVSESTGEKDYFRYDLHQHLLELEKEQSASLETNDVICFGCSDSISSPFFSCSRLGCEFKIHEYCANLPKQIKNSFLHPNRSLFLGTHSRRPCQICGQKGSSFYACPEPDLLIHPKCIFSNPRDTMNRVGEKQIRHRSHHHNLTLLADEKEWAWIENENDHPCCSLCKEQLASSPSYGCELCETFIIHQSCAELPGQIKSHLHPKHSLILFTTIQSKRPIFCDCCGTEVTKLNYRCLQCEFTLHLDCFVSLHGAKRIYDHQHSFVHNKTFRKLACDACGEENHFSPWQCTACHVMVHKKCSELSRFIRVDRHRHVLKLTYYVTLVHECDKLICQLCYKDVNVDYAVYYCRLCNYSTHLSCGEKIGVAVSEEEIQDDSLWEGSHISEGGGIQHSTHQHELILNEQDIEGYKYCDGCVAIISSPFYSCNDCGFYLHKQCAEMPEINKFVFHHHLLQLNLVEEPQSCRKCMKNYNGFVYGCQFQHCLFEIDFHCVKLMEGVDHPCHEHRLFFPDPNIRDYEPCNRCGYRSHYILVCSECEYVLGYCCAKLPHKVKHRYDEHPLSLAFEKEIESGKYYCDICEAERNPKHWFYRCMECDFYAHISCALGGLPYIKFGSTFEIGFHDHPVTYVEQSTRKPPPLCRACGKHCHSRLLECGRCNFQVHAIRSCYGSLRTYLQY